MATTTDDGFHEIQLNGKQLVFLFMSVVVVAVVIFLCGVLVGRGVRAERGPLGADAAPEDTVPALAAEAAVPAAPSSGAPATANENLTYPERLATNEPSPERLRPAEPAPSAAQIEPAAPPPAAPASASALAAAGGGPGFAIQVAALRQRDEADTVARNLTTKGYPAYVINPEAGAPAVYRVRVGKYKDRREAESVAARLQKEEQFKPWIVR